MSHDAMTAKRFMAMSDEDKTAWLAKADDRDMQAFCLPCKGEAHAPHSEADSCPLCLHFRWEYTPPPDGLPLHEVPIEVCLEHLSAQAKSYLFECAYEAVRDTTYPKRALGPMGLVAYDSARRLMVLTPRGVEAVRILVRRSLNA